jgi:hypothetical protein
MDWKGINDTIEVGTFWSLSRDAVTCLGDHGEQQRLHQIALQQLHDLFFILQRRGVAWGGTSLVLLLVMFSAAKKRQSCKNSINSAASAQNDDFYCKKRSFALLLLTNPLPLTILNNLSMVSIGIGCLLSLTLGQQRVIIMVISAILVISVILDGEV